MKSGLFYSEEDVRALPYSVFVERFIISPETVGNEGTCFLYSYYKHIITICPWFAFLYAETVPFWTISEHGFLKGLHGPAFQVEYSWMSIKGALHVRTWQGSDGTTWEEGPSCSDTMFYASMGLSGHNWHLPFVLIELMFVLFGSFSISTGKHHHLSLVQTAHQYSHMGNSNGTVFDGTWDDRSINNQHNIPGIIHKQGV